ncbi:MAG: T9SS type A sorting domain-containing protein [Flavobacteriales bacterium]|nr:T9SS type A sorting domain-containing protein [Flavobacteriales bacterium]
MSYYISLADTFNCAVNRSDAYFSPTPMDPTLGTPPYLQYVQPHVMADSTVFYTDKENWMRIEGSYTSSGGENYITIGNLHQDNQTDTLCNGSMASVGYPNNRDAYYYMDNFSLEEVTPVDAGADTSITNGDAVMIGNNLDSASSYSWLPNYFIDDVNTLNPTVNPPVTTTYYVTKTQCSVVTIDSVTVFVGGVGIATSPSERAGVRIYPNPTSGELTIELLNQNNDWLTTILDTQGRTVAEKSFTGTIINLKLELENGVYLVRVTNQNTNEMVIKKLIVQH